MTTADAPICNQAVIADGYGDGCCGPEGACGVAATWLHSETGLALCDEHETNARKYSFGGGTWRVGDQSVSYPDGWTRVDADSAPVPLAQEMISRIEG